MLSRAEPQRAQRKPSNLIQLPFFATWRLCAKIVSSSSLPVLSVTQCLLLIMEILDKKTLWKGKFM
ncbi:MAG TPA: hypothetical protein VIX18_03320, partial [Nitrospirota bacterium]